MGEHDPRQTSIFDLVATVDPQPTEAPLAADGCAEGSAGKVDAVEAPSRGSTGHVEADDATTDKRIVGGARLVDRRDRKGVTVWSVEQVSR